MTKHNKAASLHKLGYSAQICDRFILITNPRGAVYRIDPDRETCSCPYSGECCHLLGFRDLLLDTSLALSVRALDMRGAAFPWAYTEAGMALVNRAAALSDRAFDVLLMWEGRRETEETRRAA